MSTKLTLRIDENIISDAKEYARTHATSLSRLIARYLSSLHNPKETRTRISPRVLEISGILPRSGQKSQIKKHRRYLQKKYQ